MHTPLSDGSLLQSCNVGSLSGWSLAGSLLVHVWFMWLAVDSVWFIVGSLLVHWWFILGSCVVHWWFVVGSLDVAVDVAVGSLLFSSGSLVVLLTFVGFGFLFVPG